MGLKRRLIRNIAYPLWVFKNRSKRLEFLKEYEETQFLSSNQIKQLEWSRLRKLLSYSYRNCPFYQKKFDDIGLKPEDIKQPEDMLKIPPINKIDIQNNLEDMKSNCYDGNPLIKDMTGGSTGSPMIFYYDKVRLDSREASGMRHDRWAGWDIGDNVGFLWGAIRDASQRASLRSKLRDSLINNSIFLDASSLTEEKLHLFAHKLNRFRPKIIFAYSNTIELFARFIEINKIPIFSPKAIITSAEVLLPKTREHIESVFCCKIFNRYGSREVGLIASECDKHRGMHINGECLYVEIICKGRHADDGEIGEVVITDLLNFAMPLIRYRIGDMARCTKKICNCGRGLPLLDNVEGRVTDFFITKDRRMVSGIALATYMITNIEGIKQVQLIQDHIDRVKIKLVRNDRFSDASCKELLVRGAEFLGEDMKFKIELVDFIPKEPSGKFRFSVSNVNLGLTSKWLSILPNNR